jgi:hypothetical protein
LQVCVIPLAEMEALGREVPSLQRQFNRVMSREIGRGTGLLFLCLRQIQDHRSGRQHVVDGVIA